MRSKSILNDAVKASHGLLMSPMNVIVLCSVGCVGFVRRRDAFVTFRAILVNEFTRL